LQNVCMTAQPATIMPTPVASAIIVAPMQPPAAPKRIQGRRMPNREVVRLQDFLGMDHPDFLGMGPPDFLGMDPPDFLGMGPPAGAAFRARWRAFLHAAAALGAERRCQEAMHFRG
jgi:hypothetical protein